MEKFISCESLCWVPELLALVPVGTMDRAMDIQVGGLCAIVWAMLVDGFLQHAQSVAGGSKN